MGRIPATERKYEVQNLWDRHHQVLRLTALGMETKQVASITGLTPQMVSNIKNSTLGRDALAVMRGALDKQTLDVGAHIQEMAKKAVVVLEGMLDSAHEGIRMKAATDILDRAGHAAQKNLKVSVEHKVTQEDIEAIKARAMESGLLSTQVAAVPKELTDVTVIDVTK